jgi:DUF4097 and DUF4098 domain-containing protein YvlB
MTTFNSFTHTLIRAAALALVCAAPSLADTDFKNVVDADPEGSVEINGISGKIDIVGWDQPKVEVTGDGDLTDRVHIRSHDMRTSIDLRSRRGVDFSKEDMHLQIHVPIKSSVSATWVTADVNVANIQGDTDLRTVSGNLSGEVGGDLRANTSTGNIRMSARKAQSIEVKTISGEIQLNGGNAELDLTTVSGNARIELATLTRGRMKSISGNITARLALASDADLDGESVSGNLRINFPSEPGAYFDVQSISGKVENCFGPKVEKHEYGPGERLDFKSGSGKAHVRIETKSGDVNICTS